MRLHHAALIALISDQRPRSSLRRKISAPMKTASRSKT